MTTTASVLKNSPTQWFGDRGFCQNCGLIAHDDHQFGLVHTGSLRPECEAIPASFNADGSAVCAHRDLSVCPLCAAHPFYVEVVGAHYWVPEASERAELRAEMGVCPAHEIDDPACGEFDLCPVAS